MAQAIFHCSTLGYKMSKKILVSILMPMRNAETYVAESISSLLQQTYSNFELVIVNDGSTDKSQFIAESFLDSRIKMVMGEGKGVSAALNIGLGIAQGKYICRCDADDLYPSGRLKDQVEWLEDHSNHIAVSGKFSSIDEKSSIISEFNTGDEACDITQELLNGSTRTTLCSYLVRRDAMANLNGYREYFITAEDIDMQLRLAEKGSVGYIPNNMYFYRIHNDSITHVQSSNKRVFYERLARDFSKQRLKMGQDDLQRGNAPEPPVIDNKSTDSVMQIIGYMIGESWRLHREKKKLAALSVSVKACIKKPFYWLVWKNIIMILIKR